MRAFVGIPLADELVERTVTLQHEAERYVKMKIVKTQNLHWTVKFFANVSETQIEGIKNVLDGLKSSIKPFSISLQGLGVFPNEERPSVLWIGTQPEEPFAKMLQQVNVALSHYASKGREAVPHLTIGRVKSVSDRPAFEKLLKHPVTLGEMAVDRLVLFQSVLKPEGPVYQKLYEVRLSG
ncbi:MAG: RNA 2',3'-cyclic phosphodiesterase [Candidatus Aenigmarchaeota archaeon]|nr:RNA 2',3'-cyclic phosphodiesterase [Candidatus Aenigmarchaeota archaeon]